MRLRLFTSHRNSAGERVRIALDLKGVAYEYVSVPSLGTGEYRAVNPQGLMPALEVDGVVVPQSGAILDFVDRTFPDPPLLPADPVLRAQSLAFAALITGEMHALTVNRVRRWVQERVGGDGVDDWVAHWLGEGHRALEETLARRARAWPFCFGEAPGWADLHLVPQLGNARRHGVPLDGFPLLLEVEARCAALDAFQRARGEHQPDAPGEVVERAPPPSRTVTLTETVLEDIGTRMRNDFSADDDTAAFLDLRDGELKYLPVALVDSEPEGEEDPHDIALANEIHEQQDRFVQIPDESTGPGRLDAFLDTIADPALAEALHRAARGGRGAYRRVRDALADRDQLELWFAFEKRRDCEDAIELLAEHGVGVVVKPRA